MRKLISLLAGLGIGALIGAGLAALFAPVSGPELLQRLRAHVEDARQAGRVAAEKRQAELEAKLDAMRRQSE